MAERKYEGFLPGAHPIEGYGAGGFRFGSMSHRGSILALPSGIHAWSATAPQDIDIASLELVFAEPRGSIEHLLIGTGTALVPLGAELRQRLRETGIRAEPMSTGAAARTYSILLGEKRLVAAALLAAP
ncbi:Mth938-like domain-containing protein [Methylocapsa acidiphila]|uniref:Mth938-like domain-containing protein n=1 Tax=Methylocapsa acidiphila TaxID=133552 RepID=UPI0004045CC4|nr:Mth938-like domain-containing protein [Methylocapsa acidiphila]